MEKLDIMDIMKINYFDNVYVSTVFITMFVLYASFLGPKLPPFIEPLLRNPLFRIVVLFLLVVRGNSNPMLSIVVVIAFMLSIDVLNTQSQIEKFTNRKIRIEKFRNEKNL